MDTRIIGAFYSLSQAFNTLAEVIDPKAWEHIKDREQKRALIMSNHLKLIADHFQRIHVILYDEHEKNMTSYKVQLPWLIKPADINICGECLGECTVPGKKGQKRDCPTCHGQGAVLKVNR